MIERHHLSILREIERQGSMTAAAEALHLSQSALSHTIKKLEQQTETKLWLKEGRQLIFTETGHYLLNEASRILPQLERVDETLKQFSEGELGTLRIGMECHPCYQWLLKVLETFLKTYPGIDIDVKQEFQFGGIAALFNHDIDLLVTPDPLDKKGITYHPVFNYEQVLVVSKEHPYAEKTFLKPQDLSDQILYTYPVEIDRLDIYKLFLTPANCSPRKHKTTEATEIMLQLVAANRGVTALPYWLVKEYEGRLPIKSVRLGKQGIQKKIFLGIRCNKDKVSHAHTFIEMLAWLDT